MPKKITAFISRSAAVGCWLLAVALLLEGALQLSSYINQNFIMRSQETNWLTSNVRIVTMGDSNTYGLYLDKEDSYPKQLEAIWNTQHTDRKIEVINLGYPGANSSRLVANFQKVIQHFQPDIVLVMTGANDSWTTQITEAETTINNNGWQYLTQWLKLNSRIYRLFCLLTREPFQEDALKVITTSDPKQSETAKNKPATINYKNTNLDFSMSFRDKNTEYNVEENMQKNMEKLIQNGIENNIKVFLMTYAANKGYYKQANKVTRKTAQENRYPYLIDTIKTFSEFQTPKGEKNEYFFTDLHATALGNKILATEASRQLELKLAIPLKNNTP